MNMTNEAYENEYHRKVKFKVSLQDHPNDT